VRVLLGTRNVDHWPHGVGQVELAAHDPSVDQTRQANVRQQPIDASGAFAQKREGVFAIIGRDDLVAFPPRYLREERVQIEVNTPNLGWTAMRAGVYLTGARHEHSRSRPRHRASIEPGFERVFSGIFT
jgi:hypothetical protein